MLGSESELLLVTRQNDNHSPGKVKWTTVIFVLCNISAICTEMLKTYDIMIGLRQLLCMCKAEKTQLNDSVAIGGFLFNEQLQTKYKR